MVGKNLDGTEVLYGRGFTPRENVAFAPRQTWVTACHRLGSHTHEAAMYKLIYCSILYSGRD